MADIINNSEPGVSSQTTVQEPSSGVSAPTSGVARPSIQAPEAIPSSPSINDEQAAPSPIINQEPAQPVQTTVPNSGIGESVKSPEATVSSESLSDKYARLAEEFRKLTQKQYEEGLNPDEMKRKRELTDMAEYGLFIRGQRESLLADREKLYLNHRNLVSQELSDPKALAEEYRNLNRKALSSEGLKPEEIERLMHLRMLANNGSFQDLEKSV